LAIDHVTIAAMAKTASISSKATSATSRFRMRMSARPRMAAASSSATNATVFVLRFYLNRLGVPRFILQRNGADGIGILVSVIESGPVTLHDPSMRITTGFTLRNLQSIGNDNGIDFNGDTASDVTIKNASLRRTDLTASSLSPRTTFQQFYGSGDPGLCCRGGPEPAGRCLHRQRGRRISRRSHHLHGVAFLDSSFNGNAPG
jgi:hypothetical protein